MKTLEELMALFEALHQAKRTLSASLVVNAPVCRAAVNRAEESLHTALAEVVEDAKRLDWLERNLFDGKWGGTIGESKSWHMAGPYRHALQQMRGETLRTAIDSARSAA